MGKRYFCDYCDRSFQDNLHNRKKHLNGVQHLRAKRVWYDLFRDAAAILQEEQTKKPCRKFLQTGQCDFGSNCRFSHMTEQDLEKLSAQVQREKRLKELQREGADIPPGTIEDWLDKRAQRLSAAQSSRDSRWNAPGLSWSPAPPRCSLPHGMKAGTSRAGSLCSAPRSLRSIPPDSVGRSSGVSSELAPGTMGRRQHVPGIPAEIPTAAAGMVGMFSAIPPYLSRAHTSLASRSVPPLPSVPLSLWGQQLFPSTASCFPN
uniref:Zinc finger matrin-type protein 5 n=2 Tax=Telluraves TaxID=3073808 RepID=A0A674H1T4_TAEGU